MDSTYWKRFKTWLWDFDKKEAFWALSPLFAFAILWLGLVVFILFKFRHHIWQKFFIFCFLIYSPISLHAKCALHDDNKIFKEAKYLLEGDILTTSFKPEDLRSCNFEKRRLSYTIRITNSLGKKLPFGEYQLKYDYQCGQKPSDMIFTKNKSYLLAVKSVKNLNLELVDLKCGWWGWDMASKNSISQKLNDYCSSKEKTVDDFIENSKACKKDSDCDYIAHSTAYIKSKSCHRFVNKFKIPEIQTEIKSLSGGVCIDPPLMLCKAPLKEFIKCKNMKCSFPN